MKSNLNKQLAFQELACQEIPSHRQIPSFDVRLRRLTLDLEETTELAEAYGTPYEFAQMLVAKAGDLMNKFPKGKEVPYNEKEVLDALIDKEVINNGSIIESGLKDIYQRNYDLVYDNNMTKCCDTPALAEETISEYRNKGIKCSYRKVVTDNGIKYVVIRNDGKLLKPIDFEGVKLDLE